MFRTIRRYLRDSGGAASIELVIWIPLLTFWMIASVSAFGAFNGRNAAANAAFTLSDVMSRQIEVDEAFLAELQTLHANLLPGTGDRTLRISSIQYLEGTDPVLDPDRWPVLWSRGLGELGPLTEERVPLGLLPQMADTDTVILVETSVPHWFFTDALGARFTVWRHELAVRPRFVAAIAKVD